jgi:hypothetical protein
MPPSTANTVSNTDIVLVVLADLGGATKAIDVEDVAEAAWQAVPARFSWPRHQQYPDLDAVDVTLRAAKKNDGLVSGSKRERWMLTPAGVERVTACRPVVEVFIEAAGNAGRAENRRERGGSDSVAMRERQRLMAAAAVAKATEGRLDDVTVYDFMDFFNVNQYMPERKYDHNRQRILNIVRDDPELTSLTEELHARFGATYRTQLQGGARDARA